MRTIEVGIYPFNELNKDVQQKVLEKMYDINVDHDWWDFMYDDARQVNIEPKGFDIDRGNYFSAKIDYCYETANLIVKEHGDNCETRKLADKFIEEYNAIVKKYSDGIKTDIVTGENEDDFDNKADYLEEKFRKEIKHEYLIMLRNEYEYKTSEEAIKETIKANNYEFTADGEMFNY